MHLHPVLQAAEGACRALRGRNPSLPAEEVSDAVHDAMVKLLICVPRAILLDPGVLHAWMRIAAWRILARRLERRSLFVEMDLFATVDAVGFDGEAVAESLIDSQILLAMLSRRPRLAVTLRAEGYSMQEIADRLAVSREAAYKTVSRARGVLREFYGLPTDHCPK